jgi:hypothetical protein
VVVHRLETTVSVNLFMKQWGYWKWWCLLSQRKGPHCSRLISDEAQGSSHTKSTNQWGFSKTESRGLPISDGSRRPTFPSCLQLTHWQCFPLPAPWIPGQPQHRGPFLLSPWAVNAVEMPLQDLVSQTEEV